MTKLSAIILAKNAETMIADCLDSVSFCDEIIVIDDGSSDRTAEIAKRMDAKVFPLVERNFAERRNYGLRKAKGKWVLYIDTDERISPELRDEIQIAVSQDHSMFDAYRFPRKNFYLGNNEWPYIEKLERLFKRASLETWQGTLHETARVAGEIGDLDGYLLHYTHQDLTSMVAKTIQWSEMEAELRFNANHPKMTWWRFFRVMATGFYGSYVKQKGYKAGTAGLVESMYQSYSMFITYARLWEMQNKFETKKEE
jgi:glycosyltransferase involved in cell wall biosynthesis